MRILIVGGGGFIGGHLVRALAADHRLVIGARDPDAARARLPGVEVVAVDLAGASSVADWLPLLQGIEVVINAVGIFSERRGRTFEQVQHRAPCALFRACEQAGVARVIQISALGADGDAVSPFLASKQAADACLRQLSLDWVILKPSLVVGRGGRSAELFRAWSALPLIPVIGDGAQPVQPVHVDDLVAAVRALLSPAAPTRVSIDVVGPRSMGFGAMLQVYRRWLGPASTWAPGRTLAIPYDWSLLAGRAGEAFGSEMLGRDSVRMLAQGSSADAAGLTALLGRPPRDIEAVLNQRPASQAERWHARLWLPRPLLRISIGLLWLFTGIVSLGLYPPAQSYVLLAQVGIAGVAAPVALYGAALVDLGLGLATLARWHIQWVGRAQIALMIGYSLLISLGPAELWLHPFGPVSKNLPLIAATLVMLVLEDD